ncbi:hypothetical protein T484DRAFT_1886680 [Baffinella frigidus]|nr:hypothetical protein T484DRAFT_1886680 [Cryptophyta sp. CCMP2293]
MEGGCRNQREDAAVGGCRRGGARGGALSVHPGSRSTGTSKMAFVLLLWVLTLVTGGWAYVQGAPTGVRDPRPRVCLRRPVAVPAWRGPALRLRGGDGGGLTVGTNGARTASAGAAPVPVEGVKGADAGALEGEAAGTAVAERVLDVDELKMEAMRRLGASLRIGGSGTARRKFKNVRTGKADKVDDTKFQNTLKRLGINPLAEIEELTMFKENGGTMKFVSPKVLASVSSNTFVVQGTFTSTGPGGAPEKPAKPAAAAAPDDATAAKAKAPRVRKEKKPKEYLGGEEMEDEPQDADAVGAGGGVGGRGEGGGSEDMLDAVSGEGGNGG